MGTKNGSIQIRTTDIVTIGDEEEEDTIQALCRIALLCLFGPPMFVFGFAALRDFLGK